MPNTKYENDFDSFAVGKFYFNVRKYALDEFLTECFNRKLWFKYDKNESLKEAILQYHKKLNNQMSCIHFVCRDFYLWHTNLLPHDTYCFDQFFIPSNIFAYDHNSLQDYINYNNNSKDNILPIYQG